MADVTSTFSSLSSTESSNSPSGATNVGAGLDDNLRMTQALLAAWRDQTAWGILTLTSVAGTNTITATLATAGSVTFGPTSLTAGMKFLLVPAATNTGAITIAITSPNGGSSLGTKNIFAYGAACTGAELVINVPAIIEYDGTQFNILGLGFPIATQGNQETGTSVATLVTPGRQQFHPSAAKVWGQYDQTGGIGSSYNLTSVTDNGVGNLSPVFNVDFSSSSYTVVANAEAASGPSSSTTFVCQVLPTGRAAGGCNIATIRLSDFSQQDVSFVNFVAYGDQ